MLTRDLELLLVLQKIINLTCRQPGSDVTKLSRWIRCLFTLSISYDESISMKCIDEATQFAAKKQGVSCSACLSLTSIV